MGVGSVRKGAYDMITQAIASGRRGEERAAKGCELSKDCKQFCGILKGTKMHLVSGLN